MEHAIETPAGFRVPPRLMVFAAAADIERLMNEELEALGVTPAFDRASAAAAAQADRDAWASQIMRQMATLSFEIGQRESARDTELEMVTTRYNTGITRLQERMTLLDESVKALAAISYDAGAMGGEKQAKSKAVGYGTYGGRRSSSTLEVKDEPKALEWLTLHRPDLVRVALKGSLEMMRERFTPDELVECGAKYDVPLAALKEAVLKKQETVPAGVELVLESVSFYATPLPAGA